MLCNIIESSLTSDIGAETVLWLVFSAAHYRHRNH